MLFVKNRLVFTQIKHLFILRYIQRTPPCWNWKFTPSHIMLRYYIESTKILTTKLAFDRLYNTTALFGTRIKRRLPLRTGYIEKTSLLFRCMRCRKNLWCKNIFLDITKQTTAPFSEVTYLDMLSIHAQPFVSSPILKMTP